MLNPKEGELALPDGNTLFWKSDNPMGTREYYSGEVGGGVNVWITCLVNMDTLKAALEVESVIRHQEGIRDGGR